MAEARKHCSIVVGTRSAAGAVIASNSETLVIPAERVNHVLDSTGAGDMFAAGFLYGLTHGADLTKCAKLGAIAAAEVISHYGPRPMCSLGNLAKAKGIEI
jgi:sugar/nucleoside kinase (ribokinase family)